MYSRPFSIAEKYTLKLVHKLANRVCIRVKKSISFTLWHLWRYKFPFPFILCFNYASKFTFWLSVCNTCPKLLWNTYGYYYSLIHKFAITDTVRNI